MNNTKACKTAEMTPRDVMHFTHSQIKTDMERAMNERIENSESLTSSLRAWQHAVEKTDMQRYSKAQQSMASSVWDSFEVRYVLEAIAEHFFGRVRANKNASESNFQVDCCRGGLAELRQWTHQYPSEHDGKMPSQEEREQKVSQLNTKWSTPPTGHYFELLDIGSCYNPFQKYFQSEVCDLQGRKKRERPVTPSKSGSALRFVPRNIVRVVALDLHPAAPSVYQCDWLNVGFHDSGKNTSIPIQSAEVSAAPGNAHDLSETSKGAHRIRSISLAAFDIAIMSYFLSFLPTPQLRFHACKQAVRALRQPGSLLIIVEGRHGAQSTQEQAAAWPVRWTDALNALGLQRQRFDTMKMSIGLVFVKTAETQPFAEDERVCETLMYF